MRTLFTVRIYRQSRAKRISSPQLSSHSLTSQRHCPTFFSTMATVGNLLLVFAAAAALVAVLVVLLPSPDPSRGGASADVVVRNATIYTSDPSLPFAQAMALKNGRILRLGDHSSIRDLVGHGTLDLDLRGKVVLPGFIDSHTHLLYAGLQMARVELRAVKSKGDFVRKVEEAVRDRPPGEWLLGGGWNNAMWGGDLPISSWIDDVTSENPVWLSRMDGHMGLANSLALKLAGITNITEDPDGGTIVKTNNGEPTGLLVDSAMKLLQAVVPEVSVHERRDALVRASKYALTRGVTMVIDFGRNFPGAPVDHIWQDLSDVYRWADYSGTMLIRVCLYFPIQTWLRVVGLIQESGRVISQWIYFGGVKGFADGSLGSSSALFYEPYEDDANNCGLQVTEYDRLLNMTVASDKSGLQVAIHAIGDKANDMVLDLFKSVDTLNGVRDRRFRIEHAQHLVPGAIPRFGQQRVIASVQPDHLLDDAGSAEKKIGISRAQTGSYLFKSLLSGGAKLAFGSDWPVADINPLRGIKTALTRIPPGQDTAWIPTERVALTDAINAYTISAAYASFLDNDLGSLSPGKFADFVVFPATSWDEFVGELPSSVEATYICGVQAYP